MQGGKLKKIKIFLEGSDGGAEGCGKGCRSGAGERGKSGHGEGLGGNVGDERLLAGLPRCRVRWRLGRFSAGVRVRRKARGAAGVSAVPLPSRT